MHLEAGLCDTRFEMDGTVRWFRDYGAIAAVIGLAVVGQDDGIVEWKPESDLVQLNLLIEFPYRWA